MAETTEQAGKADAAQAARRKGKPIFVPMDKRELVRGKTSEGVSYSYQWGVPLVSQTLLTFVDTLVEAGVTYFTASATIDGAKHFDILLVPEKKRAGIHWTVNETWGWVDAETIRDAIEGFSTDCETFGESKDI